MLELFPFEFEHMKMALDNRSDLKRAVGADIPEEWPQHDYKEALPFFIEMFAKAPGEPTGQFLVVNLEAKTVVGDIGFHGSPREDGFVEIGYAVIPAWRNRGIATQAIRHLINRASTDSRLKGLEAQTATDNFFSQKALLANGFACDDRKIWRLLF